MKKTFAYMATGILLGVAIMLIPSTFFIGSSYTKGRTCGSTQDLAPETERPPRAFSIAALPLSLVYVGLMFVVSLILALGVYSFFKRLIIT